MNAKQLILEKIKDGSFALMTDEQIARKLKLRPREGAALRDMLHALVREGELICDSSYRFGTAKQFGVKRGVLSGNERGFGFFMPEDGSGDLFIPHRALKGALHGDTVLAIPVRGRSDDEGEIVAILERGLKEVVGTFRLDRKAGYLKADERKFSEEVYIPFNKTKYCKNGDKAVARITSYARDGSPAGEIIEILGEGGDFFVEELALIRTHNLHEEFPEAVIAEAQKKAARGIIESDLHGRLDLRGELIITVDGEDTRDIDDAISVSFDGKVYHLGVHIADVSNYVPRNGIIDKEAYSRGTSVYFPDRVLPMLPPALSNDICSLNEGVDRLTLSCLMTVDKSGKVLEKRVVPSVINSRHRMTYKAVTKISEGDGEAVAKYPDLVEFVETAVELTKILQTTRANRGGVDMDIKEAKILYEDGKITIPDYERTISHEMIEQFMVLANESVATLMTERKMPFVYRVHESPSAEKAGDFLAFLREAGVNADFDPESVSPADYKKLLDMLEGEAIYPLVNRVMLRSMMKAKYSPENLGHFGLASDCYCHFTSPIRRYPDLCIHRIIKESLVDAEKARAQYASVVAPTSEQSSLCEKNAADAEREVDALYTVAYMQNKIGEEYDAIISGVTSFGVFAELANTVEGLIPIGDLPDDYYDFDEKSYTLRGTRASFRLGEKVRVRVDGVDWGMRRTQFHFLNKIV
ncbi:MAG: ribonuclease R [Clostridiales bacterium]|nr:ribonuclease R [Clostridiales bacterium]